MDSSPLEDFVALFSRVHAQSESRACCLLISTFASCFSMLSPHERHLVGLTIARLMKQIGDTIFEDGTDFVDFLQTNWDPGQYDPKDEEFQ